MLGAGPGRLEADDLGNVHYLVRVDLFHLDADALNDRLAAWTVREARGRVPGASAFVSFQRARPASFEEASLDLEERWHGLEPTLQLDLEEGEPDLEAFAALVPAFLRLVTAQGRPEGWRRVDEGNAE